MLVPGTVRPRREAAATGRGSGSGGGGGGADVRAEWAEGVGRRAGVRPGMPAVCVLRPGVDRGLAGPGDVAGQAAAAGCHADRRARGDRDRVLRCGESRTLPWARRAQAAVLVAALADPGRGWDAN